MPSTSARVHLLQAIGDTGQKKCYYIYEYALNSWSSCQIVQIYYGWDKFPKKYKRLIETHNIYA